MDSLFDPARLRGREDVEFLEETRTVDRETFETVRDTADDHVAVGITDDEGSVLLMDDGSHGWSLLAFAVDAGEDWAATARRGVATLIDATVDLEGPERVRRVDYRPASGDERRTTMYNVVVRAAPVSGRPPATTVATGGGETELGWFDEVPARQEGDLADDIRLFLD